MTLVIKDRVKETTTTTGTGSISLGGAVTKFITFSSVLSNADTTYYAIEHEGSDNEFEVGIGTYTSSGNTLTRTTILASSNSNNAVNFSAGTKNIFMTYPADKAVYEDASGNITIPGTIDGRDLATDGTKLDGIAASANNYSHPNHSGEVTSTADGATVIADNVVDEANLKVSNSPTNGYMLTAQSGNTGGLTWAAASGGGADLYAANESSPSAQPSATGANAVAIGDSAVSGGTRSMALQNSNASGNDSFAAGIATNSASYGSVGAKSRVIGEYSKGSANNSTAIGYIALASAQNSMVFGNNSTSSHTDAIVIGGGASSSAADQITLGHTDQTVRISSSFTLPTADGSANQVLTAAGDGSTSWAAASGGGSPDLYAANEVSVTTQPSATGDDAVAIGDIATASAANSMAIGHTASTSGSFSVAFGRSASSTANNAAAIGYNATASGTQSVALGNSSVASGTNALAGPNSTASATNSFALGQSASASNFGGAAFGKGATTATNNYNVAIGNSYTSGEEAFAAAIGNNSSSYGASGANSIAIGDLAKATNSNAVCISNTSTASASNSAVLGGSSGTASANGSVALGGSSNVADGIYATAKGYYGNANGIRLKHATGVYPNQQGAYYVLGHTTSDATPIALNTSVWTPNATNQVVLPNNSAFFFSGTCIAREQAADGTDVGAWEFKGAIRREANAGTTTLIKSTIDEFNVPTGWALALSADTTNGCLKIQATGVAATDIRWVATVQTSEVIYV